MATASARIAFAIVWPIALVAWLYEKTAKLGFNVLDEGLMAAYARRILDGQVPHRDFISPRPVVSALLHMPDLALPMPLYLAGRLDGITEVVLFSILIAWLIFRSPPWEWGPVRALAAAAAALVNLHTFSETAWYTFDGLILVAAALLLIDAGLQAQRRPLVVAGLLVAGIATTTKQSFLPAPLIILLWLAWQWRGLPRRDWLLQLVRAAGLMALPFAVYVAIISALGGLPDAIAQMHSGRVVWGRSLFEMVGLVRVEVFGRPLFEGHFAWEVGLAAGALVFLRARAASWVATLAAGVLVTGLTLRLAFHQDLAWSGSWSLEVMWALIVVVVVRAIGERHVDWRSCAVLLMGWMAMLSWGYELPALVTGSRCLAVANWALGDVRFDSVRVLRPALAGAAVAVAVTVFLFSASRELEAREARPYYDRPAAELTASVGDVDADFRGMRTSPAMSDYMHGLAGCLAQYPAVSVAILPDNPGLYPAMGLHNPFPIDWFWTNDYVGQRDRLLEAATDLSRRGDYLVLFQTVSGLFIQEFNRLPKATHGSAPAMLHKSVIYDAPLAQDLIRVLRGKHVVCGSFLGIYDHG
jgi:hypothetical protein